MDRYLFHSMIEDPDSLGIQRTQTSQPRNSGERNRKLFGPKHAHLATRVVVLRRERKPLFWSGSR